MATRTPKTVTEQVAKILRDAEDGVAKYPDIAIATWGVALRRIETLMRKATERSTELEEAWKVASHNLYLLKSKEESV